MRRPLASAALFAVLSAMSAAPRVAEAQFGGLIKRKIAEKIVDKAAEKVEEKKPAKDSAAAKTSTANEAGGQRRGRAGRLTMAATNDPSALGSELTADTLERVLRGLDAVATKLREGEAAQARRTEVDRKLADLRTTHASEVDAFRQREGKVRECQDVEFRRISGERSAAVDQRMKSDPNFREHASAAWQKYMPAAMEAQRKGDSATVVRLQLEMYRQILGVDFDARKDTVAAVRKCGALPRGASVLRSRRTTTPGRLPRKAKRFRPRYKPLFGSPMGSGALCRKRPWPRTSSGRRRKRKRKSTKPHSLN